MRSVLVGPLVAVAACCCLCGGAAALHPASLPSPPRTPAAAAAAAAPAVDAAATLHPRGVRRRAPLPLAVVEPPPPPTVLGGVSTRVRRFVYRAIEPLDRGDFRWEFLVPWTNKTLSTVDKFIVCSTFIGLSFTLQTLADPGASVGVHLSYIAQFFSYAMGDPIGFRLLAVLTAVLEIGGNLFETKEAGLIVSGGTMSLLDALANVNIEDVFPIFYDQLFIVINGYYILRWLLTQETLCAAAPPPPPPPPPHPAPHPPPAHASHTPAGRRRST